MKIRNLKHIQMKTSLLKRLGVIIMLFLAYNNIFAQLQLTTQTPVGGLEIGNLNGVFRFVANNPTGTPIVVNQVNFTNFRGVQILDNPSAVITLNGNTYNTNLSNNIFTGPVTINPNSSLIIDYTAKASCSSVFDVGEVIKNTGTISYNGKTESFETNSYGISWANLTIPNTQITLNSQTQTDFIVPISNIIGSGGASQIRFTIIFPNDAKPLPQNMNPQISSNGTNWVNGIWAQTQSGNTYTYIYNVAEFNSVGLGNELSGGETFYIKFPLEVASSLQTQNINYSVAFNESYDVFCENKIVNGNTVVTRNIGTPQLNIVNTIINPVSLCDSVGTIEMRIKNNGNGVAIIDQFNFQTFTGIVRTSMISSTGQNILMNENSLAPITSDIDGVGGLQDLNSDGIYQDIMPGDSVVFLLNFKLLPRNVQILHNNIQVYNRIIYKSLNNTQYTLNSSLEDVTSYYQPIISGTQTIHAGGTEIGTNSITVPSSIIFYNSFIKNKDIFLRLVAPQGFHIEGGTNIYEIQLLSTNSSNTSSINNLLQSVEYTVDNTAPCGPAQLYWQIGYRNSECGQIIESIYNTEKLPFDVIVISDTQVLQTNTTNIIISDVAFQRISTKYIPSEIENSILYVSDLNSKTKYTQETTPNQSFFSQFDTVEVNTNGQMYINQGENIQNLEIVIEDSKETRFNFLSATVSIQGNEIVVLNSRKEGNKHIIDVDVSGLNLQGIIDIESSIQFIVNESSVNWIEDGLVSATYNLNSDIGSYTSCYLGDSYKYIKMTPNLSGVVFNSCSNSYSTALSNGLINMFPNEYYPLSVVNGFTIQNVSGIDIDINDIQVFQMNKFIRGTAIPFNFQKNINEIRITFNEPIVIDHYYHNIELLISPDSICYNGNLNAFNISFLNSNIYTSQNKNVNRSIILSLPVLNVSTPPMQNITQKTVSWDVIVNEIKGSYSSPFTYMKWIPQSGIILNKVTIDGQPILLTYDGDTAYFTFNVNKSQSRLIHFEASITDCQSQNILKSLLRMAISCSQINYSDFNSIVAPCFDRELNVQTGNLSLIPSNPSSPNQYTNLCDTLTYGVSISQYLADSSQVSFWFNEIPSNVVIENNQINYQIDSIIGNTSVLNTKLVTPLNNYISTDIIQANNVTTWQNNLTNISFNMSIGCDPTKEFTDITAPIVLNVARVDICGNQKLEAFTFKPKIQGFERLDSIKVFANATGFDQTGLGTVNVTALNLYPSLVDSVYITATLPDGVSFKEGSTNVDYFDTIFVDGKNVIWAFEKGQHLAGSEQLDFTFNVTNDLPCNSDSVQIFIKSSLEREVDACDGIGKCLVKATSDTADVWLKRTPPQIISTIDYPTELCSGSSADFEVKTNSSASIEYDYPTSIDISNNIVTAYSNTTQTANIAIKATSSEYGCVQDTSVSILIKPLRPISIFTNDTTVSVTDSPLLLDASPLNGIWSGEGISVNSFNPSIGRGTYTLTYTYNEDGYCESKDSITIRVKDCSMPTISVEDTKIYDSVQYITVPVFISPILDCPDCAEIYNLKYNLLIDTTIFSYSSLDLTSSIIDTSKVFVFANTDNNSEIIFQLYRKDEILNAFSNNGGLLMNVVLEVKQRVQTEIKISSAYANGFLNNEEILNSDANILFFNNPIAQLQGDTICKGASITLEPTIIGIAPYTYLWNTGQTTSSIEVSEGGVYSVEIIDANGGKDTVSATIVEYQNPEISLENKTFCHGSTITLEPTIIGSSPYTYLWNTGQTTTNIDVNVAGLYTLKVTDNNGCQDSVSVSVIENQNPVVSLQGGEICSGSSISLEPSVTGNLPYTYLWNNGLTTANISVNTGGEYTVKVTDGNGCIDSTSVNVIENQLPIVSLDNISICNGSSANLTPNVSGNSPFIYEWSNGLTTPSININSAGIYSVSITDSKGCTNNDSATVTVNQNPTISMSDTSFCSGASIKLIPIVSGNSPFNYVWSNSETLSSITVSSGGVFGVEVTDVNNCIADVHVNVIEKAVPTEPIVNVPNQILSGSNVTATISNIQSGVIYNWSGANIISGQNSSQIQFTSGLFPVNLCVTASKDNCVSTQVCNTITELIPLTIIGNDVVCKDELTFEWTYLNYSVSNPNSGSVYTWTISNSSLAVFNSGNTGANVNIRFLSGTGNITLTVTETINGIVQNSGNRTITLNVRPNTPTGIINGPNAWNSLCPNQQDVEYSISNTGTFFWTVPTDANIISGQGTNTILVDFGANGGNITAFAMNGDGCNSYQGVSTWVGTGNTDCASVTLKSMTIDEDNNEEIDISQNVEQTLDVNLHPQPVKTILYITTNFPIINVILYSNTSSQIAKFENVTQIDVSNYSAGVYYVKVVTELGEVIKPILIQK